MALLTPMDQQDQETPPFLLMGRRLLKIDSCLHEGFFFIGLYVDASEDARPFLLSWEYFMMPAFHSSETLPFCCTIEKQIHI